MLFYSLIKPTFLAFATCTLLALQVVHVVQAQDSNTTTTTADPPVVVTDTDPAPAEDTNTTGPTNVTTLPPVVDCIAGTAAINSDVTLITARAAAVAGVIDLKNPLNCKTKGDTLNCEYDFGDVKSNYETVCAEVGGNMLDQNFEIQCKHDGSPGYIIYSFNDAPTCAAPSCDESKYYEALTATTDALATEMNNITGIKNCEAEISAATTTTSHNNGGVFVVVVSSALLALTVML